MKIPYHLQRNATLAMRQILEDAKSFRDDFNEPLVLGGRVVPRGSIIVVPSKFKDEIVEIGGQKIPFGLVSKFYGGTTIRFFDFPEPTDDLYIIEPTPEPPIYGIGETELLGPTQIDYRRLWRY